MRCIDMTMEDGLDVFNDCLEHSGKWTWPNGNNSPEYNKWYYETVAKVKNGAQDLADAAADKWNNRGNEVKYIDEDTAMMPDGTYRSREWYEAHKDEDFSKPKEASSDPFPNVTNVGDDDDWHEDNKGVYRTNDEEWRHQQARKKYADKEKKKRNKSKQAKNVNNLMYAVDRYVTHSDISEEEGLDLFNDYLEHHGIMGMKWGVKNGPPYPLDADDHNASERRANWEQSLKKAGSALKKGAEGTGAFIKKTSQNTSAEIHKRSEASKAAKAEKAENKRHAEEEQRNQDRRTAINTANVQYAEDNFADMSEAEINEMLRRVDLKARVDRAAGIGKEEKKSFVDTVDNIANGVNKVSNWATTGINTYNTVAKVYNSFNEEKMPVIDGDFATRKAEEKKKQEAKAREAYYKLAIADPSKVNRSVLAYLDDNQRKNVEAEIDRMEKKNKAERELREATEKKEYEAAEANRKQRAIDEYDARVEDLYRTIKNDPSSLTSEKVSNYSTDEINSAIDRSNATINLEKAKAGEYVGKGGGGGGKNPSNNNPSNNNPSNNSPGNTNNPVDQDAIDDAIDEKLRQLGLL